LTTLSAANAAAPAPRTAAEFQDRDDFSAFPAAVEGAPDIRVFKVIFSLRRPATLGREQPAQVLCCVSANMLQCSKVQKIASPPGATFGILVMA
jgi:hypothetical protein